MTDLDDFLNIWAEAERTGDAETTAALLTDDFVGIGPLGFQLPKPAWLDRLTRGDLHYDELFLDETSVREYGGCAVVVARWNARGTARGHALPEAVRTTMIIISESDRRRLAGIQYSFIAGSPGAPGVPAQ